MQAGPFKREVIVQRALTLLIAGQIALAAIVIGFVSNTWTSVSAPYRFLAFVVVCGSGAHFFLSLIAGALIAWLFQSRQDGLSTSIAIACSVTYIYCSLIVQHSGLAQMLMERPWRSFFPFGNFMINMLQGSNLEAAYYTLPFAMSCAVAFICYLSSKLHIFVKKKGLL